MNMKICCLQNVRKPRYIKGSDEYVTLDILLKFDSLDNMKVISSGSKYILGRSGKGLITSMVSRPKQGQINTKSQGMSS